MKIAIAKIGATITFSQRNGSAANADILYALRTLKSVAQFTICSKRTANTVIPKALNFQNLSQTDDFNDFDCVLVFNGSINFYGGQQDNNLLALYKALAKTHKPIIYVQTDGALFFKQLWPLISHRDWAKDLVKEDFYINRKNVYYITQGISLELMNVLIEQTPHAINPIAIFHYPWERCILTKHHIHFPVELRKFASRKYDLGFGGYIRNTHKKKRIEHYYDSPNLNTLLFGNLRGISLNHTKVEPKVSYQQFVSNMENCRSTVIVGDKIYNSNFHTLRMYESLLAGCLVLIDRQLDPLVTFYHHEPNGEELLVDNVQDVASILRSPDVEELAENLRYNIICRYSQENMISHFKDIMENIRG